MTSNTNNDISDDISSTLPSLDLNTNPKTQSQKNVPIIASDPVFIEPQPVVEDSIASQVKSRSRGRSSVPNTQKTNTRSQTSVNKLKNTIPKNNIENTEGSQRPRTQSASSKRLKKNDKGENPLHLAVMNVTFDHQIKLSINQVYYIN